MALSTHLRHGRRAPYTCIGIERLPCVRCGHPAYHSWQACADKRLHRPLCIPCDVELNEIVLRWVGDPDAETKLAAYRAGHAKLFLAQLVRLERAGRPICPQWVVRLKLPEPPNP